MAFVTKKSVGPTYESIAREINAGIFKPVYFLMGEESYYIDRLADLLVSKALRPEERDFNLITLYGADVVIDNVLDAAKGFPMGASRLVVLVKEAQNIKDYERLEYYLKQPQASTILVFCYKNGTIDRRKKGIALLGKIGVLFESKHLYDSQLPSFINSYLAARQKKIEPAALQLLIEYVGADLNRMAAELDKLCLSSLSAAPSISVASVAAIIGVSKEYNLYELQDALAQKDVLKTYKIKKYFDGNPKDFPIQRTLPTLFRFFSNLMLAYYSMDKTESGIASWIGVSDWQFRKTYAVAMRNYRAEKVMRIVAEIRRTDARSKGVGSTTISSEELMKELLSFILH
ncbi:DNA polymerase III subunit delta [Alloprevotella tannerae]|uniref:DNA polymerase III subunit delta n=1 Tax=Alloprevotella tannerae TaxID=76122 RepID=UPI00288BB8FA|nr:DNA polymerase III subunit delta [Alloprevotella tannerae]